MIVTINTPRLSNFFIAVSLWLFAFKTRDCNSTLYAVGLAHCVLLRGLQSLLLRQLLQSNSSFDPLQVFMNGQQSPYFRIDQLLNCGRLIETEFKHEVASGRQKVSRFKQQTANDFKPIDAGRQRCTRFEVAHFSLQTCDSAFLNIRWI